jgi:hypothetical protein
MRQSDRQKLGGNDNDLLLSPLWLSLCDNQSDFLLEIIFFVFFSIMQVNTSITELNLGYNGLDAEVGKALGKALEVSPIFIINATLSISMS